MVTAGTAVVSKVRYPPAPLPLTELHREISARMLGNGYCTRPRQLDCAHDSACENCVYFQTTIGFRPTLQAQHDDAAAKQQTERADLFAGLLADQHQDAS